MLLFVFMLLLNINASETPTLILQDGASLRTTGDRQGIRFIAELDTLDGVSERGFYVAKGDYTLEDTVLLGNKYSIPVSGGEAYNKFTS